MSQHCRANPCCGDRPCSGVPLPQHSSGLVWHNERPKAEATPPQTNAVGEPVVPITTGMRELRISLIARAVRQSLRNYGHKVAESTLPECIAGDVERTLVADEKVWASARDCGINGGDLSESRDNIGSAYTRSTPPPVSNEDWQATADHYRFAMLEVERRISSQPVKEMLPGQSINETAKFIADLSQVLWEARQKVIFKEPLDGPSPAPKRGAA